MSGACVHEDGAHSETAATPELIRDSLVHNLSPLTPSTPANWSHVDDRPISLPSEYLKVKEFVGPVHATPRRLHAMEEHKSPENMLESRREARGATPQTPVTGVDR